MRVLLDSNVWLAILTTDGFCRRVWRRARHDCSFFVSQGVLGEIEEKLRDKFGFSPRHAHLLALFVRRQTQIVEVVSTIKLCRDPDDDAILAAALDSGCSHVVTGDADLLVLKQCEGARIVTPHEFMESIPADEAPIIEIDSSP